MTDEEISEIIEVEQSIPDYEPDDPDEKRRVFALAVIVDHSEAMKLSPDDFMAMCHRVNQWLKDGLETRPPKPTLRGLPGGKA